MAALPKILRKLRSISIKRCLTAFMVVSSLAAFSAGISVATASASGAAVHEGQDGNNLVCNGVHTKAQLKHYANGAVSKCVEKINGKEVKVTSRPSIVWQAMGITPAVASTMKSGTVCSNQGLISSGYFHGPVPSEDVLHRIGTTTFYTRPLAVWGRTCYSAWVGHTEDGQLVAILKGCGNAETTKLPPAHPVTVTPGPTPAQSCVAKGGTWSSPAESCTTKTVTVTGNCNITVTVYGGSGTITVTNTIVNSCNTTTPPVTTPPPATPATVSCSLALNNPSGNTVNATVYITGSNETGTPTASITWASGVTTSASVNGNTASGSYTFPAPGTYTVTASVQATGSTGIVSSQCSQSVTIPTPTPPPVKPQVSCSLALNNPSGNTVNATVYIDSNETNNTASITWAPNVTTSAIISGTTAQGGYTFPASGTYTVSATVQATGSTGSASSQCSSTVTIPPPVVTPPSQPPLVNNVTQIEFVYIGSDYPNVCADITAPTGDSVTVTFSAVIGNFPSASFTFVSVGTNQVCTTYYAPTNSADVGSDTITVTATDNTTHLYGVGQSLPFAVQVAPSNP
jgi:flagellar hook assembly protein FlgD